MNWKVSKKITALFVTLCMLLAIAQAALAASGYAAEITNVTVESGVVKSADITVNTAGEYTVYAAVYTGSALRDVDSAEVSASGTVDFTGGISFDAQTQTLKCFVWDGNKPVSKGYSLGAAQAEATVSPTEAPSTQPTETPASEYTVNFAGDGGVSSIDVYYTQDYTSADETDVSQTIARNGSTGETDTSGDGQINFLVNLKDGYEISAVTATEGAYKNIKNVSGNYYRITKITDDLTVTITTKESSADPSATETPAEKGSGTIHLMNTYIDISEVESGVTLDDNKTVATITLAGEYTIDGTLNDGQIAVNYTPASTTDTVTLNLDGVTLTNSTGNAITATGGAVTIASVADTVNTITASATDTVTYDTTGIYSTENIEIKGDGTLNVVSTAGNGIRSKETVEIGKGTLNVTAGNNGIKGDEEVKLTKKCGTVTINSTGDGIKSDNAPTLKKPSRTGIVTINGGTINITTGTETAEDGTVSNGDGIQADTLLTVAAPNADNPPVVTINAKGEAVKANFSHLDLNDGSETYKTNEETLAAGDGCIVISGGTITAAAGEDGIKAAKDITVSGGTVTVTEAGDDGIQAGDIVINTTTPSSSERIDGTVTISGGAVDIKKAAGDGIVSTQTYAQSDGTVTIVSEKDGIQAGKAYTQYDISGSGNDETILYETNGVVNITGGNLTITASGGATLTIKDNDGNTTLTGIDYSCKGIKARKLIDISGGTLNINALDDAIHSNHTANISGGTITVQSCDDGVHGEYFLSISGDAYIDVQKSYEGIEGSKIYISGGETYVAATDDGANAAGDEPTDSAYTLSDVYGADITSSAISLMAGPPSQGGSGGWGGGPGMNDNSAAYGYMEVTGGLLYINAGGDGFDSNGDGVIKGGVVLVNGPAAGAGGNGVFDIGDNNNTLTITGGTVIGVGTSSMPETPTSTSNSQAYVLLTPSTCNANTAIQVLSGSNEIITYVSPKSYNWIFVSTPSITSGTSYTVKYGGTVSGGTWAENYNQTYGIKTGAVFSGGSSSSATAATGGSSGGSSQPGRPW